MKMRKTVSHSQETIKFRTPSLWANLPEEHKLPNSLNIFKRKTKNCKCETYPCHRPTLLQRCTIISRVLLRTGRSILVVYTKPEKNAFIIPQV